MKTYPIISSNFRYVRPFIAKGGKGREDRMIFSIIFTVLKLSYLEANGFNLENKKKTECNSVHRERHNSNFMFL